MKKAILIAALALQAAGAGYLQAAITAGGAGSGIKLTGGDVTGNVTLSNTNICITNEDSTLGTVTATRVGVLVDDGTDFYDINMTGSFNGANGAITLSSAGDRLRLNAGSTTAQTLTVSESATVEGVGSLGGGISVASTKTLTLDMQSPFGGELANDGTVTLAGDLTLSEGGTITGTGTITGNNNRLTLGDGFDFASAQNLNDITIDMAGDITATAALTIGAGNNNIIGNGHTLTDGGGNFALSSNNMTWSKLKVADYSTNLVSTVGTLTLNNVIFDDGISSIAVDGSTSVDSPGFLGGSTTWNDGSVIMLNKDMATGSTTWLTASAGSFFVNGQGNSLDLKTSVLDMNTTDSVNPGNAYLANVVLNDVVTGSIVTPGYLYLNNVTWSDDAGNGIVRIMGTTDLASAEQGAAQVSVTNGLLFADDVTFDNGATIELLSDVTLAASTEWTFSDNSVINGNGHVFDVSAAGAKLVIADGKTLKLRNMILKGWGAGDEISWAGSTGTLDLSDVTIVLGGSVTLASGENLDVYGPVTIVTSSNTFTATAQTNNVYGVTIWYDVLETPDVNNVNMTIASGGGRVAAFASSSEGDLNYSGSATVGSSAFLNYEVSGAGGRQVTFDNSSAAVNVAGNGRTFMIDRQPGSYSASPIIVSGDSGTVNIDDLTINGFSTAHLTDEDSNLRYNNRTILKLQEDEALASTLYFAADSGDAAVLDLRGHTIDMSDASALIQLAETDVASTLTIRNGRILNLSGAKLAATATTNTGTIVLQDVAMVLDGATTFTNGNITIKGDCSMTSTGRTASFTNSSAGTVTIDHGAKLTLGNGITYSYENDNSETVAFTFNSPTATIALDGATLQASGSGADMSLLHGTLRIDGTSTVQGADSAVVTFGTDATTATNELHVDIDPAAQATLNVTMGS